MKSFIKQMSKKSAVLIPLILIFVSATIFTSCSYLFNNDDEDDFVALEVIKYPTKTTYIKGETLSLSGLAVQAIQKDGSRTPYYDYITTPAEGEVLNELGTQTVVISKTIHKNRHTNHYQTGSFSIEVVQQQ